MDSNNKTDHGSDLLRGVTGRFIAFCKRFSPHFKNCTRDASQTANQYLRGLIQAPKKNMERMEEVVPGSDEQALQHFTSNSPWDKQAVLDQVALEANDLLGGRDDSFLIIDESAFGKKGEKSAGVARQWNGRQGKVDNCQVGVFAALAAGNKVTPVDERLYLPKEWVEDKARCLEARIPEAEIVLKSKTDLALEMVKHQRQLGVCFRWVGADGFYGKNPAFLRGLEDMDEIFLVDVHKDQHIYLEDPKPVVPTAKSKQGRKPEKLKAQTDSIRVDKWTAMQPEESWDPITLRDSTKGIIEVEVLHARVYLWDGEETQARHWHLIVRRDKDSKSDYKFSVSNAQEDTPVSKLAYMQGQRYWIERTFEDGKSEVGMADYQVRLWPGWHHHMALVMMAMLFMLKERLLNKDTHSLLSCADVATLLSHFLPRRDVTVEEVLRQLDKRHRKRQASIDSAYKRQRYRST